jgi:hypothetical protein
MKRMCQDANWDTTIGIVLAALFVVFIAVAMLVQLAT